MKKTFCAIIIAALLATTACKNSSPNAAIEKAVAEYQESAQKTGMPDKEKADNLLKTYQTFIDQNPKDEQTPEYLFKMAEIYQFHKEYDKGMAAYQTLLDKYPDYAKNPETMFLMGFAYENYLKNPESAKKTYEAFLQKYPTHQLAKDAKFSLDNLGKSPEEVMDIILKKNAPTKSDTTAPAKPNTK